MQNMAALHQPLPQSLVVVDLAIQEALDASIFISHGLVTGGQVNDGQALKADIHETRTGASVRVRSAMAHRVHHALNGLFRLDRLIARPIRPCNPAHIYLLACARRFPERIKTEGDLESCAPLTGTRGTRILSCYRATANGMPPPEYASVRAARTG